MSQRHNLLNTTIFSSDDSVLRDAARKGEATVVEVAECNYHVPLPWLACFQESDLLPSVVSGEKRHEILVPCVARQKAIENLVQALPLFEQLTGERKYARDFWQRGLYQLLTLQLPYLTMDISAMLMNVEADKLRHALRGALLRTEQSLEAMKGTFFEYFREVPPLSAKEAEKEQEPIDERRRKNLLALDAAIVAPAPGAFREERRTMILVNASMRKQSGISQQLQN